MRTRLVTFLGTGSYSDVRYAIPADSLPDREATGEPPQAVTHAFVARAIAEAWRTEEVVVVGTDEAYEKNYATLEGALSELDPAPSVRFERIPTGQTQREQWEQFSALFGLLSEKGLDRVLLDITHGFRSQPFFAGAVVAYHLAVREKPRPAIQVLYGKADIPQRPRTPAREEPVTKEPAPGEILDYGTFVDVLEWAMGMRVFLASGRAGEVAERTTRLGAALRKDWASSREGAPPRITELGKAIQQFSADFTTLRTGSLLLGQPGDKGSPASVSALLEAIRDASGDLTPDLAPLALVLDRLRGMLDPLCTVSLQGEKGRQALAALARLYLRMGRALEAAATVREAWPTLAGSPEAASPGDSSCDREVRSMAEGLVRRSPYQDEYEAVGELRNDLEHGGYRDQPVPAQKVHGQIERQIQELEAADLGRLRGTSCFLNLTNHPSDGWSEKQRRAALALAARIEDLPFPPVPPEVTEAGVSKRASKHLKQVPPDCRFALVQGEPTMAIHLVQRLQERGVECLVATTERCVEDQGDGKSTRKFRFVRFRRYPRLRFQRHGKANAVEP